MTDDGTELVTCCTCGFEMPERLAYAATVSGLYQCGECWAKAADDEEFEDRDEHNRD